MDVSALLEGLREVLAHSLDKEVTVHLEGLSELSPVLADRGQLETALVNLATNARDAMPDGEIRQGSPFLILKDRDRQGLEVCSCACLS